MHGARGDFNPYAYVGGRVASATDPAGLAGDDEEPVPPDDTDCMGAERCISDVQALAAYHAAQWTLENAMSAPAAAAPVKADPPPKSFNPIQGSFDQWLLQSDNVVARFFQDDRNLAAVQRGAEVTTFVALSVATAGVAAEVSAPYIATLATSARVAAPAAVAVAAKAQSSGELDEAEEEVGTVVVTAAQRLAANTARGNAFQGAVMNFLRFLSNTTTRYGTTKGGTLTPTIPDGLLDTHLLEVKDVLRLSLSPQFQAQLSVAKSLNLPLSLIVSPRNVYISRPLIDAIVKSGGVIVKFDSVKGVFTQVLNPSGPNGKAVWESIL